MIRVECPHCHKRYRTQTEAMGRPAVCTKCEKPFKIGDARPPFRWKETDLGEDSWIGVPPPPEPKELKDCIICKAPLDEGVYRCPECGANQITGVVRRRRPDLEAAIHSTSFWSRLPKTWIVVLISAGLLGGLVYWLVSSLSRTTELMGDQLADQRLIQQVADYLRGGGDQYGFPAEFRERVSDESIRRFLRRLSARDVEVRAAVVLLVAFGRVTDLDPVLELAGATDKELAVAARRILELIGPRRLVELASAHESTAVRVSAAKALCFVFDLDPSVQTLNYLSEPMAASRKETILTEMCRPWPQAVGTFAVTMNGERAPFAVQIEQIGKAFILHIRDREFVSRYDAVRTFELPIEQWCAATGTAVDTSSLRNIIEGALSLTSPAGVGWEGSARIAARQAIVETLPGFLPVTPPLRGQTTTVPVLFDKVP